MSHSHRTHRIRRRLLRVCCAPAAAAALLVTGCSAMADDGSGAGDIGQRPERLAPHWVDPDSVAARQVDKLHEKGERGKAALLRRIAEQPVARWVPDKEPRSEVERVTRAAADADRRALLVVYNLPHRDCGQYSRGGAQSAQAYRDWIAEVAAGIGDRPATVVVEPDAIPHLLVPGCTPREFHGERYELLAHAVKELKKLPDTDVYLDAGNPDWVRDPGGLVEPLRRAGIAEADGFALNVSNYQTTESNEAYGKRVSGMVGGKPFVIDTSRNGNGPVKEGPKKVDKTWCNPAGRALGEAPTVRTGDRQVAAYLWVKQPGDSDGECRGGPRAGVWWTAYALELARNAARN
ncbi:glycoside hydrolase family 6 protein [Streptomyces boncukensis]|uniref:Glucanase n=1 Tax=Streptomyces boncukensis TaxID=2711219 RepID=A0A6G4WP44_9ACTN|nr:glycoside hydrolase family 6 protein [Streptomyces boncukensis]NGO67036.1 glycoside hydrolase family 6 protein [Streptomyces boncukensis]